MVFSSNAQDFYFGIRSGYLISNFSITENDKKLFLNPYRNRLTGNIVLSTIFSNNIELETGMGYYSYHGGVLLKSQTVNAAFFGNKAYSAISIPISMCYRICYFKTQFVFNIIQSII